MKKLLLPLLAALLLAAAAHGAPAPDTPAGMLDFAASLATTGDTYRAATEYMRVLHHFGDDAQTRRAALHGLGGAYAQAGRWEDAAQTLAKLHKEAPTAETRQLLGDALIRAGRHSEGAELLLAAPAGEKERALGTLAWLKAGVESSPPPEADAALIAKYRALPEKSPTTAGFLSAVLPGSGHLYVDRPRDGAIAFLLNAAFIWGTWEAAKNEEWALTGVLGACELFWYSGTIVGAVNGAHKWNRREEERFFEDALANSRPRWSAAPLPLREGGGLSLSYNW